MVLLLVPASGAIGAAIAMLVSQVMVQFALSRSALRALRTEETRIAQLRLTRHYPQPSVAHRTPSRYPL